MLKYIKNLWKKYVKRWEYKYYSSIDFLPLFNFFKVIETNDYRYLLKLHDYEILPKTELNLQQVWTEIQTQYAKADDSNFQIINFTQAKSLQKMELEYLMFWNIYNLMAVAPEHKETKRLLKYAGLENETFKTIEKKLKALKNRIELRKKDFDKKETKSVDFWRIIDEIEDLKGRSIDIMKTTVRQYIAIRKNIKNGNRQNNSKRYDRPKGH
jgi:hypothetical protein